MNSGILCKEFPNLCKVSATLSEEFGFSYVFLALKAPFGGLAADQRGEKCLFTRVRYSHVSFLTVKKGLLIMALGPPRTGLPTIFKKVSLFFGLSF
jgi:hypothetical protein